LELYHIIILFIGIILHIIIFIGIILHIIIFIGIILHIIIFIGIIVHIIILFIGITLHMISKRLVAQCSYCLFLRHVLASVISHLQEAHNFFMYECKDFNLSLCNFNHFCKMFAKQIHKEAAHIKKYYMLPEDGQ
jgi:hypothetical protein